MSLAVVCSHFNPQRYHAPRRNLLRFLRYLRTFRIPVFVSELAYDDEAYFVPDDCEVFRFRVSRSHIMWHKENLINLAVARLPEQFDKVAWIDPDIWFMNTSWLSEAESALDSKAIIQLFDEASWTDRDGKLMRKMRGCASEMNLDLDHNHPGFAWAARRELWSVAGGLCDRAIVGGADNMIMAASIGASLPPCFHYPHWQRWLQPIASWVSTQGGVGHIPGSIVHEWHGDSDGRNYWARHMILRDVDIDNIVEYREDRLLVFSEKAPRHLRRDVQAYFRGRSEDGEVASPSLRESALQFQPSASE